MASAGSRLLGGGPGQNRCAGTPRSAVPASSHVWPGGRGPGCWA